MAYSFVLYDGTGGTQTLTIPFGYLNRSDISFELDGADATDDVTWLSDTQVTLVTTSGTSNVEIRRSTEREEPEVTFADGSTATADELNRAALQNLYIAQEMLDAGPDVTVSSGDIVFDTFANRPAASVANKLFVATDTKVIYRDTGTVWQLLSDANAPALTGVITKASGSTVTALGTIPDNSFALSKLVTVGANKILGSVAGGNASEITCTAAGRAILDDADAAAQRATLGVPADACQFVHAHRNGTDATIANGSTVKINYTTEAFDASGVFDLTADRFTPTVAGKYLVIAKAGYSSALLTGESANSHIYKNGSRISYATIESVGSAATSQALMIVDMNGTTDYLEHYTSHSASADRTLLGAVDSTYFQAIRISA